MTAPIVVRGRATAEELAAVLAALMADRGAGTPVSPYERWRRTRLAARGA
jgi:hypothetical protein